LLLGDCLHFDAKTQLRQQRRGLEMVAVPVPANAVLFGYRHLFPAWVVFA